MTLSQSISVCLFMFITFKENESWIIFGSINNNEKQVRGARFNFKLDIQTEWRSPVCVTAATRTETTLVVKIFGNSVWLLQIDTSCIRADVFWFCTMNYSNINGWIVHIGAVDALLIRCWVGDLDQGDVSLTDSSAEVFLHVWADAASLRPHLCAAAALHNVPSKMWKSWRVKINTIKRHECIFQIRHLKHSLPLIKRSPLIWTHPKPSVSTPVVTARARTENDCNFSLMRAELSLCGRIPEQRERRQMARCLQHSAIIAIT